MRVETGMALSFNSGTGHKSCTFFSYSFELPLATEWDHSSLRQDKDISDKGTHLQEEGKGRATNIPR